MLLSSGIMRQQWWIFLLPMHELYSYAVYGITTTFIEHKKKLLWRKWFFTLGIFYVIRRLILGIVRNGVEGFGFEYGLQLRLVIAGSGWCGSDGVRWIEAWTDSGPVRRVLRFESAMAQTKGNFKAIVGTCEPFDFIMLAKPSRAQNFC